ncbi:CAP domain-containing protein [Ramlibacter humi]|nr:CAP domain-containing protein [Ramlibacter humi]
MASWVGVMAAAVVACGPAAAQDDDLVAAVAQARRQCGAAGPLQPNAQLNDAARRLSQGAPLQQALQAAGYRAKRSYQWNFGGYRSAQAVGRALGAQCRALAEADLREVGVMRSGTSYWIVAAVPFDPPPTASAGSVAEQVLALVNQARAQPRRCGSESFGAAGPLSLNAQLTQAAQAHAESMARYSYLEHQGRDGSSPAGRIGRTGYAWRSIGENIASGQTTPEQVVRDWVRSPEHCANIMAPGFKEMGVAYAVNKTSEGGIYWAQTFGKR